MTGILETVLATLVVDLGLIGQAPGAGVTFESSVVDIGIYLVVFAILSIITAAVSAVVYRWYFRDIVPEGVAIILGGAVVALYLNTASLGAVISGEEISLYDVDTMLFNIVALIIAASVAMAGRRLGDSFGRNMFALTGAKQLEGEVNRVVRTVGRVTAITLPDLEAIDDMEGYDPVLPEKKEKMAEKTLLFPNRLTVTELRDRIATRLKEDFGIGYVDIELSESGEVEYFSVGSRAAGIGPTLAPGSAAVAVQADPANSATPGDVVQVWQGGEAPKRAANAELRATAGDVVTLALDETDAAELDETTTYRLVTLPVEPQADREFASLLRNAAETMTAITVEVGSEAIGTTVGDVAAVVAAVKPPDAAVQAIPQRSYTFSAEDIVYLVGRPDALRRFESMTTAPGSETQPREHADDDVTPSDER
ncbi:potassium transporter TrkA [Halopenitus sp. H-Gu1]|uniref:potassium transporter TrkA n=1 Tax=Halopenitus sp. H-Gu1 TaxID=3242697 RepID=UPI00359D7302